MGFFKPAWQNQNETKAINAVDNINDPAELEKIARFAPNLNVCKTAVKKINNPNILMSLIAGNDIHATVKEAAVLQIKDKELLKTALEKLQPHEEGAIKAALFGIGDEQALLRWIQIKAQYPMHTLETLEKMALLSGKRSNKTLKTIIEVYGRRGRLREEYGVASYNRVYDAIWKMLTPQFLKWYFQNFDSLYHFTGLITRIPKKMIVEASRDIDDKDKQKEIYDSPSSDFSGRGSGIVVVVVVVVVIVIVVVIVVVVVAIANQTNQAGNRVLAYSRVPASKSNLCAIFRKNIAYILPVMDNSVRFFA